MIRGIRSEDTNGVFIDGVKLEPGPSQDVINHSPDGFCWGYAGSGPAQLSLALLMWFYPVWVATEYYQKYKSDVISKLPIGSDWELPSDSVIDWVIDNLSREDTMTLAAWYREDK